MQRRLGRLRLVAVLAVVVVSLTGFQSRSRIHSHHTSSGGGGCSSSHSTSHSYSSAGSGSSTSSTAGSTDATSQITVVGCTDPDTGKPAPQLRIDNSGGSGGYYFSAVVRMSGEGGSAVGTATLKDTLVGAGEIKTVGAVVTDSAGGVEAPTTSSGCSISSATKEAA
ncbi:hypothetical protein ACFXJ5_11680 [Streptomyces sp. NPDC059373]